MSMQGNNTSMSPLPDQEIPKDAGSSTSTPTSQVDFGSGVVTSSPDLKVADEVTDFPNVVKAERTLGLTNYASEPLTVPGGATYPDLDSLDEGYAGTNLFSNLLAKNRPRPAVMIKGVNILLPFGAYNFLRANTQTPPTTATPAPSYDTLMNGLASSISSQGIYREVQNWMRIKDLKNVVQSYFNRSLPFTDLTPTQRFAIEVGYTRDISMLQIMFQAFDNVCGYYKWLTKHKMQFNNENCTNLYDSQVHGKLKLIYANLSSLPVLDEVMAMRIQHLGTLHTSAETAGLWGSIIQQDLVVATLPSLTFAGGSGDYTWSTTLSSLLDTPTTAGANIITPNSIFEWQRAFESYPLGDLLQLLDRYLKFSNYIRSNYSILLGTAMQLRNKKSVDYKSMQAFVPVIGSDALYLKFKMQQPSFDYAYKERFEYAPSSTFQEDASGANTTFVQSLFTDPTGAPVNFNNTYFDNLLFARPVGPYHGEDAWDLAEVTEIGLFKYNSGSGSNVGLFYNPIRSTNSKTYVADDGSGGIATTGSFVDAFFGDLYTRSILTPINVPASSNNVYIYFNHNPAVGYLNWKTPYALPLSAWCASTTTSSGGTGSGLTPLSSFEGGWQSPLVMGEIAYTLNQLDLTCAVLARKLTTGKTDYPWFINTGYRQTLWYTFDVTLLDNALLDASASLRLPLVEKNVGEKFQA